MDTQGVTAQGRLPYHRCMRILAIDVGTGTQDILLFDSAEVVENCPKLVMPSATSAIAKRIEAATTAGEALLLTGVTMGGGPCGWTAERHLKAGLRVYATPAAARTFDDHLENVSAMGVEVVSDDEAATLQNVTPIRMQDVDIAAVTTALRAFGVDDVWDAIAIAVFDHGAAPRDVSDRTFRFDHLRQAIQGGNTLSGFAYLAHDVPPHLTRMHAVAATLAPQHHVPLLVMDTAPAGALGTLGDPRVAAAGDRLLVNLGNMHATAFRLRDDRVQAVMEHHTGLVDQPKLNVLLTRLAAGAITNAEVFDDHGHGAAVFAVQEGAPLVTVTGPRRSLLRGSPLAPYFAVPHGDMMLSGCFGLVRAMAQHVPAWHDEITGALDA